MTVKDYRLIDKDPVIDLVRTGLQVSGRKIEDVAELAFVRPDTIKRWLFGETKRPWNITVDCVLSVLGISRDPTWTATGQKVEISKQPFKVIQGGKGKKRKKAA